MITLYHVNAPGAHRTVWLLEELQLAYSISATTLDNTAHPLAAPCTICLKDDEQIIVGSYAIAEYLLNKYDRKGLRPPLTSPAYTQHQQWVTHTETLLTPLVQKLLAGEKLANTRVPFFARSILKKVINTTVVQTTESTLQEQCSAIENALSQQGWICDSYFSLADIQLSYVLENVLSKGLVAKDSHPNIYYFMEAIQARPAYKAAQDKLSAVPSEPVQEETIEFSEEP
ncbi:MAG: glutathione binding-like protein [Pelistega sp.]|nr:glutathione binding-like protein [Pelistega sp.]